MAGGKGARWEEERGPPAAASALRGELCTVPTLAKKKAVTEGSARLRPAARGYTQLVRDTSKNLISPASVNGASVSAGRPPPPPPPPPSSSSRNSESNSMASSSGMGKAASAAARSVYRHQSHSIKRCLVSGIQDKSKSPRQDNRGRLHHIMPTPHVLHGYPNHQHATEGKKGQPLIAPTHTCRRGHQRRPGGGRGRRSRNRRSHGSLSGDGRRRGGLQAACGAYGCRRFAFHRGVGAS